MIRHYYTLVKLVEEFQFLKNWRVAECFSQEKNSIVIALFQNNKESFLCFSGNQNAGSLYLREDYSRARKNTINLFEVLSGKVINSVEIIENERIIRFDFSDLNVNFILFGGAKNNIFISDIKGKIIDAFKNKKSLVNSLLNVIPGSLKIISEFPPETPIIKALSDCSHLPGKYYAMEICSKLGINSTDKLNELSNKINEINEYALRFRNDCLLSKEYYILENANGERLFSLMPLIQYPVIIKKFSSVNESIRYKISSSYKAESYLSEFKKIKATLEKQKKKLEKSYEQLSEIEKSSGRIENYKLWAETLQTLPNNRDRIGDAIEVTRWDGTKINIPLNPKLTIRENIDLYFQKVKDSKDAEKIRKKRIPIIRSKIEIVNSALIELELCSGIKEIENFKNNYKNILKTTMDEAQTKEDRFRNFDLGEGYILYVGKNAANNDELTMHFAKPNHLWLHARGSGGSHVVLRMKSKEEKPPKLILQKAAEITAYYSQQRKGKFVPVAYTFKKYVHKPKGADPGSVVISKEQVIMVEPKIPGE